MRQFEGLTQISKCVSQDWKMNIDYLQASELIRQVHIATGCRNRCIHCFSNPDQTIVQMRLSSFERFAKELGDAARIRGKRVPFQFLGSETDPSMIKGYANYIKIWNETQPDFVPTTIFTHGWRLEDNNQRDEIEALFEVYKKYKHRIWNIYISYDAFSQFARNDWGKYLDNISENLRLLWAVFPHSRIKIEVYYPLESSNDYDTNRLGFWKSNPEMKIQIPLSKPDGEDIASNITYGLFWVCWNCGIDPNSIISNVNDCGNPFMSGRAIHLYQNVSNEIHKRALLRQRYKTLDPLEDFFSKFKGIMVYPDGCVRSINYWGYRPLAWINGGNRIVSYIDKEYNG